MNDVIDKFRGEYAFLSNFYPAVISYEGRVYPSVENAYQAAKTTDNNERAKIALLNPGEAKHAGRRLTLSRGWDGMRLGVMTLLVRQKFTIHKALRDKLLATGAAKLIEGNEWNDHYWGVCNGHGENYLGKILMQVRRELNTP